MVFAMNVSLDGYVDHMGFAPGEALFRHFTERVGAVAAVVYGRGLYEVMRYWDDDHAEWDERQHAYAAAWRRQHKWVVSRTLKAVGPNATLVGDQVEETMRDLKTRTDGQIDVGGTILARSLDAFRLIDEYQLYLAPVVLGHGKPFFPAARPPLRLTGTLPVDDNVLRLSYVPASW